MANQDATFRWLTSQNLRADRGKWIVVVGREIVARGPDLPPLVEKVRQKMPDATPFVYRVPDDETILV